MHHPGILVAAFVIAALFVRPGPLPAQSQPSAQPDKLSERLARLEQVVGVDPNRPPPASLEARLAVIEKRLQNWAPDRPAPATTPSTTPTSPVTLALATLHSRQQDLLRRVDQLERSEHEATQAEYASATDVDTLRSKLDRLDRDATQLSQRVQRIEQDARTGTGAGEDREARRGLDELRQRLNDLTLRVNNIETRR